ncbi:hypothetical protein ACJZ2D_009221 [Fusarium nematophilum]
MADSSLTQRAVGREFRPEVAIETRPQAQAHRQTRTPRRRKIALACNHCRARKTRCDGRRPACSTCRDKGLNTGCVYEQGALKTQRYVSRLEDRWKEYERRSTTTGESNESPEHNPAGESATQAYLGPDANVPQLARQSHICPRSASGFGIRDDRSSMPGEQGRHRAADALPSPPNQDFMTTDAMVIVPSPQDAADCPIGESAPIAFVRSMIRTITKTQSTLRVSNAMNGNPSSANHAYHTTPETQELDTDTLFLPPRRVADEFIDSFFKFLHPILPILHEPTFMKHYHLLWATRKEIGENFSRDRPEDPVFMSTLNIVFAIGCQFSDQVALSRKTSMANKLYQRSKSLFVDEFLDAPALSTVQHLLLTGVYLQSTNYANRCWNVVGSAIRAAQSIGLHLERSSASKTQLQQEMDCRVWHTCVFLDRQLAVTFGRPTMISTPTEVPLPQMIDDDYLLEVGEGAQPSRLNSQIGAFVYSNKLFDILNDILGTFYTGKSTLFQRKHTCDWGFQDLETVLRFNRALNEFWHSLPRYLANHGEAETSNNSQEARVALGAKILYSRFLYIRIFLLRPILLLVAQKSNNTQSRGDFNRDDGLEQQLASTACALCVSTTQTLIAHISKNMDNSFWTSIAHKIHYAFSCAIVLVAARFCPISGVDFNSASLQSSWSQCIELFDHYKPHYPSACNVTRILEALEDRLCDPDTIGERRLREAGSSTLRAVDLSEHEDVPVGENQRFPDSGASSGDLGGPGFDSHWAMLDDLLQYESLGQDVAGETYLGDAILGAGWAELI